MAPMLSADRVREEETPLQRNYRRAKEAAPGALLLFRMGTSTNCYTTTHGSPPACWG